MLCCVLQGGGVPEHPTAPGQHPAVRVSQEHPEGPRDRLDVNEGP